MIKALVGTFIAIFILVIGFTFAPINVNLDALVADYDRTVVYSKSASKLKVTPTQEEAIVQQVESVAQNSNPSTNPLFLHFPVDIGPGGTGVDMTSGFGPRSLAGSGPNHNGLDFSRKGKAGDGFPILSATEGVVSKVSNMGSGGYGKWIEVTDPRSGLRYRYAHLSTQKVIQGSNVGYGELLGTMGTTGSSTGVHLHFEIMRDTAKPGVIPAGIKTNGNYMDPAGKGILFDSSTKPATFNILTGPGWVNSNMSQPEFGEAVGTSTD